MHAHALELGRTRYHLLLAVLAPLLLPLAPVVSQTKSGASHWAFAPVQKVIPPADVDQWSSHPIDRFLRAKQRDLGLTPAAMADRRTLIRRATFDLTGLPPTPEEIEAFVGDQSPDAWSRLIDRLLASPHYGEHWGRHWLDVVRYADTGGFETDQFYPNAWRYRDYVIQSLNADKPWKRFIEEQVAGDELWPSDQGAAIATGLYCVGPVLVESAMMSSQLEYEWLTDAVDTTGAAFLGLTLGCARCHNHKSDPITQTDYYSMQAIFAASDRPYPFKVKLVRIKALNNLLSDAPLPMELENDPRCDVVVEGKNGLVLFHRKEPLKVQRLNRGELSRPREETLPGLPAVFFGKDQAPKPTDAEPSHRRAALARWLTAPENPLTARVLVNRVWGWHFGQGIVRTPNDFGVQGEPPTHPELLDWLARDFVDHGWSLQCLHRLILSSRTYHLASVADARTFELDPQNRWVARFPRRRLEAESIRDALLACAGTLSAKMFGPAIVPPLSGEELTGLFGAKEKWPVTKDPVEHTRRTVYVLERRLFGLPMLAAFDPPEVMTSCPQRRQTIVPAQALSLLNSPLARAQGVAFARRLLRECGDDQDKCVSRAWLLAFGRPVTPDESKRALRLLQSSARRGEGADEARLRALSNLCLALYNANEFLFVD